MPDGTVRVRIAPAITMMIVLVFIRADAGPIGAPVMKQLIAKTQPTKLSSDAKNPLIQVLHWKKPSTLLK